jgi:hypothetical protein
MFKSATPMTLRRHPEPRTRNHYSQQVVLSLQFFVVPGSWYRNPYRRRHRFFSADRLFYALTPPRGDPAAGNVVKMSCAVHSACTLARHANVKNTLALEAK